MKWSVRPFVVTAALGSGLLAYRFQHDHPLGPTTIQKLQLRFEEIQFRNRLRSGQIEKQPWPGLGAAQFSMVWLQVLGSLHQNMALEGDWSWMFARLNTLLDLNPHASLKFVSPLSPYFYVLGNDGAGAMLILNRTVRLAGTQQWRPWFWAGLHAYENLHAPQFSGDLFAHAALHPKAPAFSAALAVRLAGKTFNEEEMPPALVEKLKKSRPEWFRSN